MLKCVSEAYKNCGSKYAKFPRCNLTQEKIDIMMNHINSYSRLKLGNKTPFEAYEFYYGSELFEKLDTNR